MKNISIRDDLRYADMPVGRVCPEQTEEWILVPTVPAIEARKEKTYSD